MKHKIEVQRTAHYYHKKAEGKSKGLILVIHGYAQLAEEFIGEFEALTKFGFDIYAPEALSKFYNKERKAVANWMTSHEREDEINDYVNYLERLFQIIQKSHTSPIHLVGFSQGVSTLMRWFAMTKLQAKSIHLIAGSIPEELTEVSFPFSKKINFYYYHGREDRLVPKAQIDKYISSLKQLGINPQFISFKGRHEIPKELLDYFAAL